MTITCVNQPGRLVRCVPLFVDEWFNVTVLVLTTLELLKSSWAILLQDNDNTIST